MLRRHVEHRDRDVGLAVMTALASLHPSDLSSEHGVPGEHGEAELAVVRTDLEHATHILRALVAFDGDPSTALVRGALRDELGLVRQRVLAGLSIRHGTEGANRVAFHFAQRDARSHALALEWLDVTLSGPDRGVIPVLEPDLSERGAIRRSRT